MSDHTLSVQLILLLAPLALSYLFSLTYTNTRADARSILFQTLGIVVFGGLYGILLLIFVGFVIIALDAMGIADQSIQLVEGFIRSGDEFATLVIVGVYFLIGASIHVSMNLQKWHQKDANGIGSEKSKD